MARCCCRSRGCSWSRVAERSAVLAKVICQRPGAMKKDIARLKFEGGDHQGSGVFESGVMQQVLAQRLACQVVEGHFLARRGQRGGQMKVVAYTHVE